MDVPLGLAYNIASYAILLTIIAQQLDKTPRFLVFSGCDTHIYLNQIEGIKTQLSRTPKTLPQLQVDKAEDIYSYRLENFRLSGYEPEPFIKFPVAV